MLEGGNFRGARRELTERGTKAPLRWPVSGRARKRACLGARRERRQAVQRDVVLMLRSREINSVSGKIEAAQVKPV